MSDRRARGNACNVYNERYHRYARRDGRRPRGKARPIPAALPHSACRRSAWLRDRARVNTFTRARTHITLALCSRTRGSIDAPLRTYIQVKSFKLEEKDACLIVASDGIWEFITPADAVRRTLILTRTLNHHTHPNLNPNPDPKLGFRPS